MRKRRLSFALVALMIAAFLPVTAPAAGASLETKKGKAVWISDGVTRIGKIGFGECACLVSMINICKNVKK